MAYNTNEERLLVKGSEQITRDLKVNRDAFINGKAETGSINDKGDLKVAGEILAGDDVTISGDLYVNGTEYINNSETAQTTDDYLVLRHNQTTPLGTSEYSGVAVHNYATGKTATITTDKDGTWRVADNTETDTDYTNISYYNGTYYTGLTRTAATVISGMKTAFDEDELDESVYYNNSYYHFDGSNWFPVSLVSNKLTLGSAITDSTTITALNALTKKDLVYFRTLTITVINPVENQPVLTRAEASDLTGGQALTWDATNEKAVGKTIDTTVTASSSNLITSGAVKTAIDDEATARDNAISSAIATEVTNRNNAITNAVNALDVSSVGGDGKYISAISETNGKISATATTMDAAPTADSTKAVTSGGVATAIGNCNSKITIAADTTTTTFGDATTIHVNSEGTNPTSIKTRTTLSLWQYIADKIKSTFGLGATKTDNAIARWDGTDGKLQNSGITINDSDTIIFPTISGAGGREMLRQTVGTNDVFRIYAGATGANAGYGEIATADDGNEPIYVRQYSGNFETLTRTATLLDGSGNTSFPGDIHVGPGKSIIADGTKANYAAIKFKDATDVNGNGIVIGAGGATVIGGGESADAYYSGAGLAAGNETMAITNDSAITFVSNLQDGYASGRVMTMGTDGKLTNTYGFVGPLTGNASTADATRGTAYCTTAAGTAAKTASMRGYVLQSGATFLITFTNANSAASALTLAVNGTTAKPIYINGAASGSSNYTLPAGTYLCTYDGTNYLISTNSINISTKMNMTNPAGTGSFSLNRKASTTVGTNSFAEGYNTTASGSYSHAEGYNTKAEATSSHAEGYSATASGYYSHAEGHSTTASGESSHAEGESTTASESSSHAEGYSTTASGRYSHTEGYRTTASGEASHTEGFNTKASENYSHAEGYSATASGKYSHAEGHSTIAVGDYSHAEGRSTTASGEAQHVQGKYNVISDNWAFVIGGGTDSSTRKNILAFDWNGNLHIFGDIYVHCNTDGTGGTKK